MKKTGTIDAKLLRMLELLAEGGSTSMLARKMGYSEGTVRVYLHDLYQAIGVKNRTEAVLWHLRRARPQSASAAPGGGAAADPPRAGVVTDESFGEVAQRHGLLATLGVMESFVGPYSRVWEAGLRVKGSEPDAETVTRARQARQFWRGLLAADFAAAKRLVDEGWEGWLASSAPGARLLVAACLWIGGYTGAAEALMPRLQRGRRGAEALSARELELLRGLRLAQARHSEAAGTSALERLVEEASTPASLRQTALAALFHVQRGRRDAVAAAMAAEALWLEAEGARRQLEAMGLRPLVRIAPALQSRKPSKARALQE